MYARAINFDVRNPWDMISKGLRGWLNAENESTSGTLGNNPKYDAGRNRQKRMGQLAGLILPGYLIAEGIGIITELNKKANGKTQSHALPAEITIA